MLTTGVGRVRWCRDMCFMCPAQGLGLIEMLIAVAVAAVIAAYAIPWYGNYQRRGIVAEGISLAAPGKEQATEYVSIGQLNPGVPTERFLYSGENLEYSVVANRPTAEIRIILRIGTAVIVTYTNLVMPSENGQNYSLVLLGSRGGQEGSLVWTCLAGSAAEDVLATARGYVGNNQTVGVALPAELAPSVCESKSASTSSASSSPKK